MLQLLLHWGESQWTPNDLKRRQQDRWAGVQKSNRSVAMSTAVCVSFCCVPRCVQSLVWFWHTSCLLTPKSFPKTLNRKSAETALNLRPEISLSYILTILGTSGSLSLSWPSLRLLPFPLASLSLTPFEDYDAGSDVLRSHPIVLLSALWWQWLD
jgi:hypothetical protein